MNKKQAAEKLHKILSAHVPEASLNYCVQLWEQTPFHFKVTRARGTKLGDYRYDPRIKSHTITVNNNLNKYSFLLTYIHEVAHLHVQLSYGNRVMPHGTEWKRSFQRLFEPVMNADVYPNTLLKVLIRHMKNPKASSYSDQSLYKTLKSFDELQNEAETYLEDLNIGDSFVFKGQTYQKLETRRTRVMCLHTVTKRKYLIPKMASVQLLEQAAE